MPEDPKEETGSSSASDERCEKARRLLADWRAWVSEGLSQVETFTKEKPAAGLALSFVTGFLLASWFRRKP